MRAKVITALLGGLIAMTAPITAAIASDAGEPVTDCPLRDAPFSAELPMIDILLSPAARAVVEKEFGMDLSNEQSQRFFSTTPPSFASILTLKEAAGFAQKTPEDVGKADAALRELPVTDADRVARCARYDNIKPNISVDPSKPAVLLFEKITGFRDGPSVEAAHDTLVATAKKKGWQIVPTEFGGAINADTLANFDAIIWNNISGDVLTLSQRQALRDFVENGGGFIAVHGSGGDPAYFWDWYVDTLIGARFAGHPRNPQFQEARVMIADASHPAAEGLPSEWKMTEEWYTFKTNPRDSGARIIATLDESSYDVSAGWPVDMSMGDEHPIAWSKVIGKGRMFYTAIGHMPEAYAQPQAAMLLENGLAWAMGETACECADED